MNDAINQLDVLADECEGLEGLGSAVIAKHIRKIATRLRGEAAKIEAMQRSLDLLHRNGESLAGSQLRMLEQLDAAQGEQQAVRALPAYWRQVAKDIGDKDSYDDGMATAHRSCADELDAALSSPTDYKGVIRADEIGVMRALAERILGNAHPEEDARVEVAYAIARYIGMDCPAALSAAPSAQRYNNPDDLSQFAAPAPVAGDAVAGLPDLWRDYEYSSATLPEYVANSLANELEAALAQDRASQAGANRE